MAQLDFTEILQIKTGKFFDKCHFPQSRFGEIHRQFGGIRFIAPARFRRGKRIRRRGSGDIWQGLWEPYLLEDAAPSFEGCRLLASGVKHQLTHRTLITDFYLAEPSQRPELPEGYVWIRETELERYAKPRLFELLLDNL